ncbi:unnamed protein product [Calypogeia fissa]
MSSTTTSSYTPPSPPVRRPYYGSCHCGHIRYVVLISLPPAALGSDVTPDGKNSVRFYKCNCLTCQKMGLFHLRAPDPPHDFYLFSPLDLTTLSDYQCNSKKCHWYFCSNCGVRCFALVGEGEVIEIDLEAAVGKESKGKMTKVWRVKEEGWFQPGVRKYLTVNAHTVEPGQEGFDLREIVDKKWLAYLDCKDFKGENRYDYPHEGGTW